MVRDFLNHCRSRNIVFLSSAFSIEAIKMLNIIGMPAWKVGSGEFFSNHILNEMKQIFQTYITQYWDGKLE